MSILWLIGVVVFLILEGATYQLICVWFALGCVAAMVADFLESGTVAQLWIFIIVSAAALISTRPLVKKMLNKKPLEKTNADRIIGQTAVVIKKIEGVNFMGQVKVNGSVWTAKADENIDEGEAVVVKAIEGVKLLVEKCRVTENV